MVLRRTTVALLSLVVATTSAFVPVHQRSSAPVHRTTFPLFAKGFGSKPQKKEPSEGAKKRQEQSSKYDEISASGGQEYSIFVRQFGSDDKSWLPCGAIAVPRNAQVSDAIYANVEELKKAIVRQFPKLRGHEDEFEFGYNLKVYPDDPIEVAVKNAPRPSGLSFGNWISNLLSPIDTSQAKPPQ
jgi:hypothetical protein